MEEYTFLIEDKEQGLRIDRYVADKLNKHFSRSFIQRLIKDGDILLNNKKTKAHQLLKTKDLIHIVIPSAKESKITPEPIPLEIIFEDEDIIVLNKPQGLVVHPAPGNYSGTLVNALLSHTKNLSSINPNRPGIVHRLDKNTSGLLVVAKNNSSHLSLTKQFQRHKVYRKYIAVVKGKVEFDEGSIDAPLTRDKRDFRKIKVSFINAKKSVTKYHVIKRSNEFSVLEIFPQTGRTHQIRVHLAHIGHPILGDTKYGRQEGFERLFLHALNLGFYHPRREEFLEFSSPLPYEFKKLM